MAQSSMKVDLSNFFKDERSQSLVFINSTWQNIKDVQDHIQNLFSLKNINLLTTDGCFLPPKESIKVLNSAKGLKVFQFAGQDRNTFESPAPVKSSKKRKSRSADEEVHISASTPLRSSKRFKIQNNPKWVDITSDKSREKSENRDEADPGHSLKSKRSKQKCHAESHEIIADKEIPKKEGFLRPPASSKTKKKPKSKEVYAAKFDLSAADKDPDLAISNLEEPNLSTNNNHAKIASTSESLKNSTLSKSPEISLTTFVEQKNEEISISRKNISDAAERKEEAPIRPSILFRCPLSELDSNIARTFKLPIKKTQVEIIENIILRPLNGNLAAQKEPKKNEAKPLPVQEEVKNLAVNGNESSNELLKPESPQEVEVPREAIQASPKGKEDNTESKEITFAETTEKIIEAEITYPEDPFRADTTLPKDTTKTEAIPPGDSTGTATEPDDSAETELILPDNTINTALGLSAHTTKTEAALPDEADSSLIKTEEESKDIQIPPARICTDNFISDSDDDVMLVDDTNIDDSDSDVEAVPDSKEKGTSDIIEDLLQTATSLTSLPTRGDTILFKLQKIKGIASSGTTEFIAGNCTYVNRRTKTITVETITIPPGIKRILSQYVSSLDDSSEELPTLSINIKDMIDAKIVVATID
ncbi:coilin [Drosophila ficusphila]|uniref:coilin n=1 Tax=Drosophila ficusphila TaxID=30025 RepID=UPI0007E70278|nr:coilin [Drosophila ficusphila]